MLITRGATLDDAGAIADVHVRSWRESYRGLLSDETIESRSLDLRRKQWRRILGEPLQRTLVAEGENGVAGFASALLLEPAVDGFDAYLQSLYLVDEAKRQGIGTALLRALVRALGEAGCRNLVLRVLRLNQPARAFYEHLGARILPEGVAVDAGHFDDVVYAFDDIFGLVTAGAEI